MRFVSASLCLLVLPAIHVACDRRETDIGRPEVADEVPPPATRYPAPPAELPQPSDERSPPAQRVTVVNPIDRAMIVTATYGGRSVQLGTVRPRTIGSFYIQAPSGTTVLLAARDSAATRQFRETVVLDPPETIWTIAG